MSNVNVQAVLVRNRNGEYGYVRMDCNRMLMVQNQVLESAGYERIVGVHWNDREAIIHPSRATAARIPGFFYVPQYWGEI